MAGKRLLERSIFATLGAGLIVYETTLDIMQDVIQRSKEMPERGARFADEVYNRLDRERDEINLRIEEEIKERADKYGIATKSDIKEIKNELKKISGKLSKYEQIKHAPPPSPDI